MGDLDRCQWIAQAANPDGAVRFEYPAEGWECEGDVWVAVRALTYREVLERESVGMVEEYELDDHARVLGVRRQYDLWAMKRYELSRCLVDFALPWVGEDGKVRARLRGDLDEDEREGIVADLSPVVGEWLEERLAQVNLRDRPGSRAVADAKKK